MPLTREAILLTLREAGVLTETRGEVPDTFTAVTDDSRQVRAGALFIAVRGSAQDGHDYLSSAERAGAAAALVEDVARTALPAIIVRPGTTRKAAALVAATAYDWPARALRLLAVTGTNGKSTGVHMLRHLLDTPGARAASLGTLGVRIGSPDRELEGGTGLTTPGPVEIQRILRLLVGQKARTVAMELSSHALHQHRAEGVTFDAAVFSNLTRDHLDYHGTMEQYFQAKALLVEQLAEDGALVVNADDPAWEKLPRRGRRIRFSALGHDAEVRATNAELHARGSTFTLHLGDDTQRVELPLLGEFNIENALGAAAAAWALGESPEKIASRLSAMPQVPGRMERLFNDPAVLRDYAHTSDSLARALAALRPFTAGRLICVFGAGGERDRGKRPLMGAAVAEGADVVIVSSDNPRTEDPERIIDEVVAGIARTDYVREADRRVAVEYALRVARPGDVVLLAGKGHETYQVIGTTYEPFDEKLIVRDVLGSPA